MILKNDKILVIGASSDLAVPLNEKLYAAGATIGLHYNKNKDVLSKYSENKKVKMFQKDLDSSLALACFQLVDDFVNWNYWKAGDNTLL